MARSRLNLRRALSLGVASGALALAACSAGDVQLNGKVFDAIGATGALTTSSEVPKIPARQGLIIPPSTDHLPPPGSGQTGAPADLAALNDPDRTKKTDQSALEHQQAEYCKVNYEQAKMRGDSNADNAKGPLGPCKPSAFSALQKWNDSKPAQTEDSE